jgi:hypothetical protein
LEKLEQRFFQHTYQKDPDTQRIDRIEKFVFGDTRTGPADQRLATLMKSLPADEAAIDQDGPASQASEPVAQSRQPASQPVASSRPSKSSDAVSSAPPPKKTESPKPPKVAARPPADTSEPTRTKRSSQPADNDAAPPRENVSGTKYPAITAIEQKVLRQSHENERIEDRLARLETSMFGKPTPNADLIDRVDRLKSRSSTDIATRPPVGSDWSDEDDDMLLPPTQATAAPSARGSKGPIDGADGEDGMSFSGRNLRKDMQNAFGGMSTGGGGSYGMGSSSMGGGWSTTDGGGSAGSGRYGFGGSNPRTAGSRTASGGVPRSSPAPIRTPQTVSTAGMGLSQQVGAMEQEILGKSYPKEPLAGRLSRLEAQIFPSDKTAAEKPLPERVNRLLSQVPISNTTMPSNAPARVAQRGHDRDLDDDVDELDLPTTAPQRAGLGKIMNQLGNMFNQTNFVGGFPVAGGNLITDPSTGMLLDPSTGNLINPSTGQVIGRRVAPSPYITPPVYAAPPVYGAPGIAVPPFSNGFAPYGAGTGIRYGLGTPQLGTPGIRPWP